MALFNPSKLHVVFAEGVSAHSPLTPRRYTLTHSDSTGDLFLTIGADYDREALATFQVRSMADEVLGEWIDDERGPHLLLYCRAQAGLPVFGSAKTRCRIFCDYMPMVLEAMRYGDRAFTALHPELASAPVELRFRYRDPRRDEVRPWGTWGSAAG